MTNMAITNKKTWLEKNGYTIWLINIAMENHHFQ